MNWILFVLAGAVFNSLKNVATRKVGSRVDVYSVAVASNAAMLPILWASVLLNNTGSVSTEFWTQMALMLPFELLVMYLFFKALTSSKLSHSFPFVSFMPVFVAIGSYFILNEQVSFAVYAGAIVIVLGAFILNVKKDFSRTDLFGALYMIGVAALWGYLIPMGSLAVTYSSAELYPAIYFSLATLLFLPLYFAKRTSTVSQVLRLAPSFVLIGFFFALFTISNWYAYSLGPATAISALAMLSIPLTSLFDIVAHKEPFSLRKLFAAVVMMAGAMLVIVSS